MNLILEKIKKILIINNKYQAYLIGILLLSLILNLSYITWGLPGEWHPDEVVNKSKNLFTNKTLNPNFFAYPSLQIYLISVLVIIPLLLYRTLINILNGYPFLHNIIGDPSFTSQIYYFSRTITAIMGTLTVYIVYLIAKKMFNEKVGLFSAFFLATAAGFVHLSHFASVDIPSVFWITLSFFCCLLILEKPTTFQCSMAGIAVGLAASTKYTGILMVVPLLSAFVMCTKKAMPKHLRDYILNKNLLIIILTVLGVFVAGSPFIVIDFPRFIAEFIQLNFYIKDYEGLGKSSYIPHIYNIFNIFGVFGGAVSLLGIIYIIYLYILYRDARVLLLIITIFIIYIKMGSMSFHPIRYIMIAAPLITICSGKIIHDLTTHTSSITARVILLMSISMGIIYTAIYTVSGNLQIKNDSRILAYEWVLKNISKTETIESTRYAINHPDEYKNITYIPIYHRKETFDKMLANNEYLKLKSLLKWADWRDDNAFYQHDDEAFSKVEQEPENTSLDALLRRNPKYLILARQWYWRFFDEKTNAKERFPQQHELYDSILHGRTPYKIVAEFKNSSNSLLTPQWEFVNNGVTILKYVDIEEMGKD
ncbi:MAG: phospholipid carrier-dependent glycosyltransferase [Methylococcaceae bacterium]